MTGPVATTTYKACHQGNHKLMEATNGGSFLCGGWTRGANYDDNTVVIDLTGHESPEEDIRELVGQSFFKSFLGRMMSVRPAGWLKLPLKDFGVPYLAKDDWLSLGGDILSALTLGHDVLITCQGGHGRTGTAVSILMGQFEQAHVIPGHHWSTDPVNFLRETYCKEAVDTADQENYVYKMLGLDKKADPAHYQTTTYTYSGKATDSWSMCPMCHVLKSNVSEFGMCALCQEKYHRLIKQQSKKSQEKVTNIRWMNPSTGMCECGKKDCPGVFVCTCGHTVHGQKQSFANICDRCYFKKEEKKKKSTGGGGTSSPIVWEASDHLGGPGAIWGTGGDDDDNHLPLG